MNTHFNLARILPTKSGCLFLLLIGCLISGLAYGIWWGLTNVPLNL